MDAAEAVRVDSFGVAPPRAAEWCIRFLQRQQVHPDDYHGAWRTRHKLAGNGYGVQTHAQALRCIAVAGCLDQLDLPNLAVIEHLFRQVQLVEYYYRERQRASEDKQFKDKKSVGVSSEEVELFLGGSKSGLESMICPDLMQHIAKELEREASINKQTRKAREERALLRG